MSQIFRRMTTGHVVLEDDDFTDVFVRSLIPQLPAQGTKKPV